MSGGARQPPLDPRALHARLARFVVREAHATRRDTRESWSLPLAARVEAGHAIEGVRALGAVSNGRVRVACTRNESRFRPGDSVRLGEGRAPERAPALRILSIDPLAHELVLEMPWNNEQRVEVEAQLAGGGALVLDRDEFDGGGLQEALLDRVFADALRATPAPGGDATQGGRAGGAAGSTAGGAAGITAGGAAGRQRAGGQREGGVEETRGKAAASREARLCALLCGELDPALDAAESEQARASVERLAGRGRTLNAAQAEGFVRGWASRPLHLVQGPPGTGKTWLLALLVAALAWRGERVLLSAMTHDAVDNAFMKLHEVARDFGRPLPLVRFRPRRGAPALPIPGLSVARKTHELRRGKSGGARGAGGGARGAPSQGPGGAPGAGAGAGLIVGTTAFSAGALVEELAFTRVVLDEASQLTIPAALAPLLLGPRALLFGDHRQLGPVVVADDPEGAGISLFAHLARFHEPTLLGETYRLSEPLARFPSALFYGGRLASAESARTRRFAPTGAGGEGGGAHGAEGAHGAHAAKGRGERGNADDADDAGGADPRGGAGHRGGADDAGDAGDGGGAGGAGDARERSEAGSATTRFDARAVPPRPALSESQRAALVARVLDEPEGPVLVALEHEGRHGVSTEEAEVVATLARGLLVERGLPADELALIAPFRLQNQEISRRLAARLPDGAALPVIDTVERIQGQEREAVIVSLTCSDPDALRADKGFFFSPERLNVALTRARTRLVVVASPALLRVLPKTHEALRRVEIVHRIFRDFPRVDWPAEG